jgi:hypothetical protein
VVTCLFGELFDDSVTSLPLASSCAGHLTSCDWFWLYTLDHH